MYFPTILMRDKTWCTALYILQIMKKFKFSKLFKISNQMYTIIVLFHFGEMWTPYDQKQFSAYIFSFLNLYSFSAIMIFLKYLSYSSSNWQLPEESLEQRNYTDKNSVLRKISARDNVWGRVEFQSNYSRNTGGGLYSNATDLHIGSSV